MNDKSEIKELSPEEIKLYFDALEIVLKYSLLLGKSALLDVGILDMLVGNSELLSKVLEAVGELNDIANLPDTILEIADEIENDLGLNNEVTEDHNINDEWSKKINEEKLNLGNNDHNH